MGGFRDGVHWKVSGGMDIMAVTLFYCSKLSMLVDQSSRSMIIVVVENGFVCASS